MTATDQPAPDPAFEAANVFGRGEPNTGYARYFSGASFLNTLVDDPACAVGVANVTFAPGCRNNWHIHHATCGGSGGSALRGRTACCATDRPGPPRGTRRPARWEAGPRPDRRPTRWRR